jgi:hypothetical protein
MIEHWGQFGKKGAAPQLGRVISIFRRLRDHGEQIFPDVASVGLRASTTAGCDNTGVYCQGRARAFCSYGHDVEITVAPCINDEEDARIEGVMRHEFGHAIDALYTRRQIETRLGLKRGHLQKYGSERLADVIAELVFGKVIRYDNDLIQTINDDGVTPRPAHLPR